MLQRVGGGEEVALVYAVVDYWRNFGMGNASCVKFFVIGRMYGCE